MEQPWPSPLYDAYLDTASARPNELDVVTAIESGQDPVIVEFIAANLGDGGGQSVLDHWGCLVTVVARDVHFSAGDTVLLALPQREDATP